MLNPRKKILLNLAITLLSLPSHKVYQMNEQLHTAPFSDDEEYTLALPIEYLGANVTPLKQIKEFAYDMVKTSANIDLDVTAHNLGIYQTYVTQRLIGDLQSMGYTDRYSNRYNQATMHNQVHVMQQQGVSPFSLEQIITTLVSHVHENYTTMNLEVTLSLNYLRIKYTDVSGRDAIVLKLRV